MTQLHPNRIRRPRRLAAFPARPTACLLFAGVLASVVPLEVTAQSGDPLRYPAPRTVAAADTLHGVAVADPFRWLEELDSEATLDWARAQSDVTTALVTRHEHWEAINQRLDELGDTESFSPPIKTERGYFYTWSKPGRAHSEVHFRSDFSSEPRQIIDFNDLGEPESANIGTLLPSPDGEQVLFFVRPSASWWMTGYHVSVATGEITPLPLEGLNVYGSIAWTPDSRAITYVRFDLPASDSVSPTAAPEGPRVMRHALGTAPAEDHLLWDVPIEPGRPVFHHLDASGRRLYVSPRTLGSLDRQHFVVDLSEDGRRVDEIFAEREGVHTFLGLRGGTAYFYTDHAAPNGKIVSVQFDDPTAGVTDVVLEREEPLAGSSAQGGNAVGMYGQRLVGVYRERGRPVIRVFDLNGAEEHEMRLTEGVGSIWGGFVGGAQDEEIFFSYLGPTHPSRIFRADLGSGTLDLVLASPTFPEAERLVTRQVFYESIDGTQVPLYLIHRKDLEYDGQNPVYLYAYGAYGWSAFIWYSSNIAFWLEQGGVYAVPAVRGGGDLGPDWHTAAQKTTKQRTVDDYHAAADWLIAQGITSPGLIVANGSSASGVLAATAMLQRPELFGAATAFLARLDLIRNREMSPSDVFEAEFGSIDEPEEFKSLLALSPYHNVEDDTCYPPTLLMAGERDESSVPSHAFKFVARLQQAQTCPNPLLLRVLWGTGHSLGSTSRQTTESIATEMVFIANALELEFRLP